MSTFFEFLHDATILKKFIDELEKNPKRTLGALAVVVLLTGAGITTAFTKSGGGSTRLSERPKSPPTMNPDGTYENLPQAVEAEKQLQATLESDLQRHESVNRQLNSRKDNAPVTDDEIKIINETGRVTF